MGNILNSIDALAAQEEIRKQDVTTMGPRESLFGPDDEEQDIIPEGDDEDSADEDNGEDQGEEE